jgi:GABA(A) receptor-associated protein
MNPVGPVLTPKEFYSLREKYPNRVPVFVARASKSNDIPDIDKKKYLVPNVLSVGQLLYIIRRQISLPPEKALFVFVNNTLPMSSTTVGELYAKHCSIDGALRVTYTSESTFGFSTFGFSTFG